MKRLKYLKCQFDENMERMAGKHPLLTYSAAFVLVPAAVLLAVSAVSSAVMLPLAWLFGWL